MIHWHRSDLTNGAVLYRNSLLPHRNLWLFLCFTENVKPYIFLKPRTSFLRFLLRMGMLMDGPTGLVRINYKATFKQYNFQLSPTLNEQKFMSSFIWRWISKPLPNLHILLSKVWRQVGTSLSARDVNSRFGLVFRKKLVINRPIGTKRY